jgi:hypothetical protein
MKFYRLTGLVQLSGTEGVARDPDEQLEIRVFPLDAARAMVSSGVIVDLKTAVGLTLFGRS